MTESEFEKEIARQLAYCKDLLCQKGKEYDANTQDRLHSFKVAAQLQGISAKQALAGMLAKHTVSIYDMCRGGDYSIEKWTEKITDHINYLLLLKTMIIEEKEKKI